MINRFAAITLVEAKAQPQKRNNNPKGVSYERKH